MPRLDGRRPDELRPIRIVPHWLDFPEGSTLIEMGATRVLCAATIQEAVPDFLKGAGRGWVTAEYSLLPRSTRERTEREALLARPRGRTQEIARLIGRSLRGAVALELLGERTVIIDCDVLQADGGTRVAAINGGYVALRLALERYIAGKVIPPQVLKVPVAGVSVGLVEGMVLLDPAYEEDAAAEVDLNLVMTGEGHLVEVQATAEKGSFSPRQLDELVALGWSGIREILAAQEEACHGVLRL